jgi:predicted porin
MNRKLMAVAVAGVFAAPAAVLAQSSTVQIYGKMTYEYGYADSGDGKPKTDVAQTPGGSAIGFRGQEKLGGGLTAWFQCESSADVRGISQDGLCTRNSAVGFKGAWGNLHFGRWDSPMKRAINMGTVGVQDTGLLGYSFVFAGGSGGTDATTANNRQEWKRRDVGWTYYESPMFSGFQILAGFTPGNAATSASNSTTAAKPRVLSIGGTFKNGPLAIGVGYEEHKDFYSQSSTTTALATGSLTTVTTRFAEGNDKGWNVGAAYTFMNKLTIGAVYLDTKYETGNVAVPGSELKRKSWNIGLDWSIAGPHGLEVGYTEANDSKGSCNTSGCTIGNIAPAGNDTGAKLYAIKYRYSFSKRTSARIGYIKLKNDSNAIYTLGGLAKNTGQDQDAIVMYLEHYF